MLLTDSEVSLCKKKSSFYHRRKRSGNNNHYFTQSPFSQVLSYNVICGLYFLNQLSIDYQPSASHWLGYKDDLLFVRF